MRTLGTLALGLLLAAAHQASPPSPVARRWVDAALTHRAGEIDEPLRRVAAIPGEAYRTLPGEISRLLREEFASPPRRDEVRRRGAILHTDIALLLPDEAAALRPGDVAARLRIGTLDRQGRPIAAPAGGSLVYFEDGRLVASEVESGHWPFASQILADITNAPADEFVQTWYRAVAAVFLREEHFGNASYHLQRAHQVLPRDAVLNFYAGSLQEALVSPRVPGGDAPRARQVELVLGQFRETPAGQAPTREERIRAAERLLRDAVKFGAPVEARVRLGRVLGTLGRHSEALQVLDQSPIPADDLRLLYFRELFLGTEYAALARFDEALTSFHRAAACFPTAQTPLIAALDAARRAGRREAVLATLGQLAALPGRAEDRLDPWWAYYRSYAEDAPNQLAAVRGWTGREAR